MRNFYSIFVNSHFYVLCRLEVKMDRAKTAKSEVKQRIIGSAMPREPAGYSSSAKEEKVITPVDLTLVYPSFNRAKSLSESKTKPISFFRWPLLPFNEMSLRLLFQSNEEGRFHQNYTFKIVDYSDAEFSVAVKGTCEYTNVFADLTKLFPPAMWVEKIVDDRLAPVYVEGDRKLYFGPLLAGKKKVSCLIRLGIVFFAKKFLWINRLYRIILTKAIHFFLCLWNIAVTTILSNLLILLMLPVFEVLNSKAFKTIIDIRQFVGRCFCRQVPTERVHIHDQKPSQEEPERSFQHRPSHRSQFQRQESSGHRFQRRAWPLPDSQ